MYFLNGTYKLKLQEVKNKKSFKSTLYFGWLFNLIPLSPLDGGRITAIISPRLWFLGVPLLIAIWVYHPSTMLIIIAVLAYPQLVKAWKYDPKSPENQRYYNIDNSTRFEYAFLYLLLAIVLALMISNVGH